LTQVFGRAKERECERVRKMSDGELLVKLLSDRARLPERKSELAAGYDIFSAEDVTVPAGGKATVATDVAVAIPAGHYGRVAPRSSLAAAAHIAVGAGVIDADYRGAVGVVLFNHGPDPFVVRRGDRIAQLILERISTPPVRAVTELPPTVRGAGGFGSTGR